MEVSVIAIGDELLIGQVTDTNSGAIARELNPDGWSIKSIRTIADDTDEILKAVDAAMRETDVVLTTGGLGPTKDDITKPALTRYFGGEMVYDKEVERNVLEVVRKRGLKINSLTAAQAYVPSSCRVIQNKVGTAPIMWFEKDGKVLVSMPGVPFEMEEMLHSEVFPQLKRRFMKDEAVEHRTFIVEGYSESVLAGAGALRGTVGAVGLVTVLAICLTPFLRLAVQYFVFKTTGAISACVAQPRLSQLIDAIGGAFGLVLGMTGAGALILLVSLVSAITAVTG